MTLALGEKQSLHRNAAKRRQIDQVGVLDAVAETSACRDERILERERSDLNGEVHYSQRI